MSAYGLQCLHCGSEYEMQARYGCDRCGGILEVKYDYEARKNSMIAEIQSPDSATIWRFRSLLPVGNRDCMVSLHEGATPLLRCGNLSQLLGVEKLYIKDESRNPSGAFKDRPIAVGVSKAKEFGQTTVVTASSGNAAAALAAYAAKARLRSYLFIPEHTPPEKLTQALVSGGQPIKVRGDYSSAYGIARQAAEKYRWMNITTTFLNPYAVEGDKTIAYELFKQLPGRVPDWILVPTGAGPLVFGIYKGFSELRLLGLIETLPRMVAVQAEGCAPIVRAYQEQRDRVEAWTEAATMASAIADPLKGYEQDGELVLKVVRDSGGTAIAVSDAAIRESVWELAGNEGVYAEPAAAAPLAAFKRLLQEGTIAKTDCSVCLVTGHGLKDPVAGMRSVEVPVIEPSLEALADVMA